MHPAPVLSCKDMFHAGSCRDVGVFCSVLSTSLYFAIVTPTYAGSLATASPVSDMNPILAACGADVVLQSSRGGKRRVKVRDFFPGYATQCIRWKMVVKRGKGCIRQETTAGASFANKRLPDI